MHEMAASTSTWPDLHVLPSFSRYSFAYVMRDVDDVAFIVYIIM